MMPKSIGGWILLSLSLVWCILVANEAYSSENFGNRLLQEFHGHKDLFPLSTFDYVGTFLVIIGLIIAASGGIGGGGILVPLLILVFGFSPKHAIPLSTFTILGSSITNMLMNLEKRHPDADRPLIDWDLMMIMEPLTVGGAIFGAYLSKLLPEWLLTISLVLLLGVTAHRTLVKGMQQYKKESLAYEESKRSAPFIITNI